MTNTEANALMPLIIGRLFKLASRPAQPSDAAEFQKLRALALDCGEALGINTTSYAPNHAAYYGGSHGGRRA